ncbi:MAG: hypothetical protein L3J37_06840 [Rhodobacteraceae bacterium]|nr:hypothetical protein [Paracoccaceae bacterium]
MEAFLIPGFFVGMSHAFETDHLAAIGTLASSGKSSPKRLALAERTAARLLRVVQMGTGAVAITVSFSS